MEGKTVASLSDLYKKFPPVEIEKGVFKYIQIEAKNTLTGETILFVRGSNKEYHKYIFEDFESKFLNHIKVRGLTTQDNNDPSIEKKLIDVIDVRCPGGGRIEHSVSDKTICVYGYSMSYGRPDHKTAIKMIKEAYPEYPDSNITEGDKEY